jgi:hypothetical protein
MRVNPNASELFRATTGVDLLVKEVGHRIIIEFHGHFGADLTDQLYVFHEPQIVCRGDTEAADFCIASITQEQQLRPYVPSEACSQSVHPES